MAENKVEIVEGKTDILLIAPHGVETEPYDDIKTAELTRLISKQLECSAIINTIYRKPGDSDDRIFISGTYSSPK